jgi:Peptidase family M28
MGFDGSQINVDEHPWAKEIGVVLNFDARGNSGPSIMFETSDGNSWLVDQ